MARGRGLVLKRAPDVAHEVHIKGGGEYQRQREQSVAVVESEYLTDVEGARAVIAELRRALGR